ncbi:Ion channel [Ancylostoma duodenale]|uniref:Ion channel n=1 Tax=Ancylostoma duodenale TaxID=51022 RepID=A0A0C2G869_9BILA|nr:Ion channel [Ancylostoma duodenale]
MPTWKKYARIVLPHVGLILLSLLYVVGGAVAFYHMERPNEVSTKLTSNDRIEERANLYVENSTRILFEAFDTHFISAAFLKPGGENEAYSWTFITALFFTATLLTTIGYGNLVPVTWHGRMFCIAYALLGVPLILITVADIGKFLSENIIWLYSRYSKARKQCRHHNYAALPTKDDQNREGEQLMQRRRRFIFKKGDFGELLSFITITLVVKSMDIKEVGFGDIVPVNREFYLLDLCYIIVGLAITTMCIDLVGIQYIRKIHYFGRAIKKYGHKKPQDTVIVKGAYAPKDINKIRFIDYGALASVESFQTIFSNMINTKSKEPAAV